MSSKPRRALDDADVIRIAAVADMPTLKAWLDLAHSRAGKYRVDVVLEPVPTMAFDIAVPVGDEPLILNNAGTLVVHDGRSAAAGVGVLLRYTLSSPSKPVSVEDAIAMEREACALDASYPCHCELVWGEGYRGSGHVAECVIRNETAERIRRRR